MPNPINLPIGDKVFAIEMLAFNGECQQCTSWCWAAVSVGVAGYYGVQPPWTQAGLVGAIFKGAGCYPPNSPCPFPLKYCGDCDRSFWTGCALCTVGCTDNPYGLVSLSFDMIRQALLNDQPVVVSTDAAHAVVVDGCAWADRETFVHFQSPNDTSRTVKAGALAPNCAWLTTSSARNWQPLPADAGSIQDFVNQIGFQRRQHRTANPFDLYVVPIAAAATDDPLSGIPSARRYLFPEQQVWRDVPVDGHGEDLPGAGSVTGGRELPWSELAAQLGEGGTALVEVPALVVRAVWHQERKTLVPVGRRPYFLAEREEFAEDEFWRIVREKAVPIAAQPSLTCGGGPGGGCGDCTQLAARVGGRSASKRSAAKPSPEAAERRGGGGY